MTKRALLLLSALLFAPRTARAESKAHDSIGERSSVAIVVDNLFGISNELYSSVGGTADSSDPVTTSIGTPSNAVGFGAPRLGVHGFVHPRVSIGASLGFYHRSEQYESTSISLAPRVGSVIPIGERSALWIRAGAGYRHQAPITALSIGAEAQYVSTPFGHFGWTFGPTFETDVDAKQSSNGRSSMAAKRTTFGVAFGVLFDF